MSHWNVAIIGGGPAGYTAGLYCARAGVRTLVLEQLSAGGQMALTDWVDNYPGFPEGIDGFTLGEKMQQGAQRFGAETLLCQVTEAELNRQPKVLHTSAGEITADAVILATGANARPLGLPGEERLVGRGISYCAACDGRRYENRTVAVVGGGSAALEEALELAKLCPRVYLIHRRDTLRGEQFLQEAVAREERITFLPNTRVTALLGEDSLTGLGLDRNGEEKTLDCAALFVAIGRIPASRLAAGQLPMDEAGFLLAREDTGTELPGVFVAGDVRAKPLRQIITAAADGAMAATMAAAYVTDTKK